MITHPLVQSVLSNLSSVIKNSDTRLLLACSGGADSTALLQAVSVLQSVLFFRFSVITVNHNLREYEETAGDAKFVAALCKTLKPPPPCRVVELVRGSVEKHAAFRHRGIEDAARSLRYAAFEQYADAIEADFILTAHTVNDVYETVLMRLFQGGSTTALKKMPLLRGRYVRPLITVNRSTVENFLTVHGLAWRNDSTNYENMYLRNRIRHFLVPALEQVFGVWQSGFDKTLHRIFLDSAFCDTMLQQMQYDNKNCAHPTGTGHWTLHKTGAVVIHTDFFYHLDAALQLRLLQAGCLALSVTDRVSLGMLIRMISITPNIKIVEGGGLRLEQTKKFIFLHKKSIYLAWTVKKSYAITVSSCGQYCYPLGILSVFQKDSGFFVQADNDTTGIGPFSLPFTIRSRCTGDVIAMKNGKSKAIKKIFNEWSVDSLSRAFLPIIVKDSLLLALYGMPLGYKNWIVQSDN